VQLTLLRGEPGFEGMKEKVLEIARLLEEQTAIPAVAVEAASAKPKFQIPKHPPRPKTSPNSPI
jgi:hypothetical protein